jgi:hypothetical protein
MAGFETGVAERALTSVKLSYPCFIHDLVCSSGNGFWVHDLPFNTATALE